MEERALHCVTRWRSETTLRVCVCVRNSVVEVELLYIIIKAEPVLFTHTHTGQWCSEKTMLRTGVKLHSAANPLRLSCVGETARLCLSHTIYNREKAQT